MKVIVQPEIEKGNFRKDVPIDTIAFFLMKTGQQLLDYMKLYHNDEIEQRILNGKSLFTGKNEKLFLKLVDDNILLQSAAIDAKK